MRAAVVVFPGSNADVELVHTLRDIVGVPTEVVWHKEQRLPPNIDLVALPGGFSFGDYLRCGALARSSAIVPDLLRHANAGGLILGICNGFQILTEIGLLPGALTRNSHLRFECRDIYVKPVASGPFTHSLTGVLRLPIAHADGRYQVDSATHELLEREGRIAFRYASVTGEVAESSNPNGSVANIAGVYGGVAKNVMGLMPHPERQSEGPMGGSDGRWLFEAAQGWVEQAGRLAQA
jgi:phosphoribosylformylglycinamidine synthase subunit PurQ / glutaminase